MTIKFQAVFKCPRCESGRTHLERVVVSQGKWITVVERDNDRLLPAENHSRNGSSVDVYMWCESGHRLIVSMEYIGGSVLSTIEDLEDHEGDLGELWTRT